MNLNLSTIMLNVLDFDKIVAGAAVLRVRAKSSLGDSRVYCPDLDHNKHGLGLEALTALRRRPNKAPTVLCYVVEQPHLGDPRA